MPLERRGSGASHNKNRSLGKRRVRITDSDSHHRQYRRHHRTSIGGRTSGESTTRNDQCIVRWDYKIPSEKAKEVSDHGFIRALAGDCVLVSERRVSIEGIDRKFPFVTNINSAVASSRANDGIIAPWYLMPRRMWDNPNEYSSGYWYAGDIGPLRASMLLRDTDPHLKERHDEKLPRPTQNSIIACQPPDFDKRIIGEHIENEKSQWPDIVLLIRNYKEKEAVFNKQWIEMDPDKRLCDRLKGTEFAPLPPISYVIVRRDKLGFFTIDSEDAITFPTLDTLIKSVCAEKMLILQVEQNSRYLPGPLKLLKITNEKRTAMPAPPCLPGLAPRLNKLPDWVYLVRLSKKITLKLECDDLEHCSKKPGPHLDAISDGTVTFKDRGIVTKERVIVKEMDKNLFDPKRWISAFDDMRNMELHSVRGSNYILQYLCAEVEANDLMTVMLPSYSLGSLQKVLCQRRKNKDRLSIRPMCELMYQVACGMLFLEDHDLVHGALSLRNIMAEKECGNCILIKISDYGIYSTVDAVRLCETKENKWTWLWWAPEQIADLINWQATTSADMWAYGVLVYEILTHGARPYSSISQGTLCETVTELADFLNSGGRLEKPDKMPGWLYTLCMSCWVRQMKRITFTKLQRFFTELLFDGLNCPQKAILHAFGTHVPDYVKELMLLAGNINAQRADELKSKHRRRGERKSDTAQPGVSSLNKKDLSNKKDLLSKEDRSKSRSE